MRPLVYRPTAARVGAAIFAGFALWWVGDLLAGPDPGAAVAPACWLLASGAAVYGLFWRPGVLVDDEGITLRNVLRNVRVPWGALEQVETRFTLTLHAGGRQFQSWAASAPGRPPALRHLAGDAGTAHDPGHRLATAHPRPRTASSRDLQADSGAAAFLVESRWADWRAAHPAEAAAADRAAGAGSGWDGWPVAVRWNLLVPAVLLFGVLAGLITAATG